MNNFHYALDILIRRLPVADADAHGAAAAQVVPPKDASPVFWIAAMTGRDSIIIALLNEPAEQEAA